MSSSEDDDPELTMRLRAQALAVLQAISRRRREMDETECMLIEIARDQGVTWREIAAALGMNAPQQAEQRFQVLGRRVSPAPSEPCQVCGGTCGIVCEKEAQERADTEFDRRVAESVNRMQLWADSAGYVTAHLK